MRLVSITTTVLAATGIVAGASVAASACEWHKQVHASTPTTVEEVATVPASEIDPVRLAELSDGAIVPRKPEEAIETE